MKVARSVWLPVVLALVGSLWLVSLAIAAEDTTVTDTPGVSISSSSASSTKVELGYRGSRARDRDAYNYGGMSKRIQCKALAKGPQGDTRLRAFDDRELGLSLHALKPKAADNTTRHCGGDQVNIQMNEAYRPSAGAEYLFYEWGLSDQNLDGAAFGQSGHIRRSDLVDPPTVGETENGNCVNKSAGTRCNGTYAPDWFDKNHKQRWVYLEPTALEEPMWHPHRNSNNKATGLLFNTTKQYGQSAWTAGVFGHAPMMWNWTNKDKGGVNRAQIPAGTKFFISAVEPFATRTYQRSEEKACVKEGGKCTKNMLYKVARYSNGKPIGNGWIELAYGRVHLAGRDLYGWVVVRHRYGGGAYVNHFRPNDAGRGLPWTKVDALKDSFTARAASANGTADDDVNVLEDEYENPTEADLQFDPDAEYSQYTEPGVGSPTAWGAPPNNMWGNGHGVGSDSQPVGDINGDGRAEPVVFFKATGRWYGVASGPTSFGGYWLMSDNLCTNSYTQYLADVNGDGKADAICWYNGTNQWYVGLSNGSAFTSWASWGNGQNPLSNQFSFGDVNGDKRADLVTVNDNTGVWNVALSTGTSFAAFQTWHGGHGAGAFRTWAQDVTGDGLADAVAFIRSSGTWQVAVSNSTGFGASTTWIAGHGVGSTQQFMGDVDGDGRSDALVYFNEPGAPYAAGAWFSALSNGVSFPGWSYWAAQSTYNMSARALTDTNGDKQADPVGMNPLNGLWVVSRAHDIRPPVAKITSGPAPGEVVANSTVTFSFTSDETDSTIQCSVDESSYAPCTSPLTRTNVPEGKHSLKVKSTDASGKTSAEAIVNYAVDFKIPDTTLGEVGDDAWFSNPSAPKYAEALYGDVTGDGKQDALAPSPADRAWHLLASDGSRLQFTSGTIGLETCIDDGEKFLANVGGDSRPDIVCYNGTTDSWTVALAGGSNYFEAGSSWLTGSAMADLERFVKDANGDGKADVITVNTETGVWNVALSNGSGFAAPTQWSSGFGTTVDNQLVGDVDGDGRSDIVGFTSDTGTVRVILSDGSAFAGAAQTWRTGAGQGSFDQTMADVTGDGKEDLVIYFDLVGRWVVLRSTGAAFSGSAGSDEQWIEDFGNDGSAKSLADLTGDGKADAVDFDATKNAFYVARSDGQRFVRATSEAAINRVAMFHSDDPFAKFECRLDAGFWIACANPHTLTDVAHGTHTLSVRAVDVVGQVDPTPATRSFTVDRQGPDVTITSMPTGWVSTLTPTLTFTLVEGGTVGSVTCAVDSGAAYSCASGTVLPTLSPGAHTVTVAATDALGNKTTVTKSFSVDVTAPSVTITNPQATYFPAGGVTVEFTLSDANGVTTRRCIFDGGAPSTCNNKFNVSLVEGSHIARVEAVDPAGNVGFATKSLVVDTIAPTLTVSSGPANGSTVATATVGYGLSANESGSTFECKLDAAAQYSACSSAASFGNLTQGSHTFTFRAVDGAGNRGSAVTRTAIVDTVAPDTTINSGPTDGTTITVTTPVYTFSANESGSTFECKIDAGSFSVCTSPYTTPALSAGNHTVSVRAKDAVGNVDATPASRTVVVDTGVDTTITAGPASGSTFTDHEATWSFTSNVAGATFECKLDSAAYAPCSSGWTTRLNNGSRTVTIRAKDGSGTYDATPAQRTFTVDAPGYLEYWGAEDAAGWTVDLPEYGGYDWAHWGRDTATSFNHKSPVASPGIGNWTQLGSAATVARTTMPTTTLDWWNGTPIASDPGTKSAVSVGGAAGRGFRVTIPATRANSRVVYLMVGALNTNAKVTLTSSDGSIGGTITPVTNTSTTTPTIGSLGFRVQSTSATATLTFDITQDTSSSTGAVYLAGATVSDD